MAAAGMSRNDWCPNPAQSPRSRHKEWISGQKNQITATAPSSSCVAGGVDTSDFEAYPAPRIAEKAAAEKRGSGEGEGCSERKGEDS